MKRAILERSTAGVLFVMVLVVFSFAERDSKKLAGLYTKNSVQAIEKTKRPVDYVASEMEWLPTHHKITKD